MAFQVVVSPLFRALSDKLRSLALKEVGLIWGVDQAMNKLAGTLSTIQNVLHDAEEKQVTDKAITVWLAKLRALAYDADDILEEWEMDASQLQLGTFWTSGLWPMLQETIDISEIIIYLRWGCFKSFSITKSILLSSTMTCFRPNKKMRAFKHLK